MRQRATARDQSSADREPPIDSGAAGSTAERGARKPGPFALFLVISFGVAVPFLLFEACFRFAMAGRTRVRPDKDRPVFYYRPADSADLTDRRYPSLKPPGTFRIDVIGDSISFGPNMQFDDTFPKRLERMLNLGYGRPVEVVNRGVSGFSTSDEVRLVRKALDGQSDLLLLQITLNDPEIELLTVKHERNLNRFAPYSPPAALDGLLTHWRSMRFLLERLHSRRTRAEYKRYFEDLFADGDSWNGFERSIAMIDEMAKRGGKPLAAVVFPLFGFELDDDYPFRAQHKKIGELLDRLSIPHIDLLRTYRGIPLSRLEVIPGIDRHPNEIAHRMAAERLYQFLVKEDLVPKELRIPAVYGQRVNRKEESYGERWLVKQH